MKVPQSILRMASQSKASISFEKNAVKSHFWTKVVVNDDCINVEREGAPKVVGLFKGKSEEIHSMNKYDCNLVDLPVIILQQVNAIIFQFRKWGTVFVILPHVILHSTYSNLKHTGC